MFAPVQLWKLPAADAPAGAPATTTVTASATDVGTGGVVKLTATVVTAPGQPSPTGRVVFRDAGQDFGAAPLVNGKASFDATIFAPGPHALQAIYTGDDTFDESISPPVTVTAGQSATTLALTTSKLNAGLGQPVTFTATITPTKPSTLPPTGSVTFFDGPSFLGNGFVVNGIATYQTSTLSAGLTRSPRSTAAIRCSRAARRGRSRKRSELRTPSISPSRKRLPRSARRSN